MAEVLIIVGRGTDQESLQAALGSDDHVVHFASNAEEGLGWVAAHSPACVVSAISLSGMDGIEFATALQADNATRLVPLVLLCDEPTKRLDAIRAGASAVLSLPVDVDELRARVGALSRVRAVTSELESAQNVVFALATAMEQKDSYTEGHGERVGMFSRSLAEHIGLKDELVHAVQIGGLLHDVGKIGIPDRILNKPGPLTPDEFEVIKRHPVAGWEICRHLRSLGDATLHCIRNHHERLDGTGYPDKLPDSDIPITTRITTICDVFDALATARAYKPAFPTETCFKILREESERGWWDKELVEAFIEMMNERQLFRAINRAKLKPLFARPPAPPSDA